METRENKIKICVTCGLNTAIYGGFCKRCVRDQSLLFDAELESSTDRKEELDSLRSRVSVKLASSGLELPASILVQPPSPIKSGAYHSFYDILVLGDNVFRAPEAVQDTIAVHESVHRFLTPVWSRFQAKPENAEIVTRMRSVVKEWNSGLLDEELTNPPHSLVKDVWDYFASQVGIYSSSRTTYEKAEAALRGFFNSDSRTRELLLMHLKGSGYKIYPEQFEKYFNFFGCAVGKKLEDDLRWVQEISLYKEEAVCNYLGSALGGASIDEVQRVQKQDEDKIRLTRELVDRYGGDHMSVLNRLKAGEPISALFK